MSTNRPLDRHPLARDPLALGLGLLALLLGAIRFVRLGAWGLWIDEAFTLADALHGGSFSNPLGYWLFEALLAGSDQRPSEYELRLLPAFAGWACIPALWWATGRALGSRAAAAAALILATSSWHLYWSQSARFYTLGMLISLVGTGLVLRGLMARSVVRFLGGAVVAASAALAHPTAIFVLPGLLLSPMALRWGGRDPGRGLRRAAWIVIGLGSTVGIAWGLQMASEWAGIKGAGSPAHLLLTTGFYVTPLLGAAALIGGALGLLRRQPAALVAVAVLGLGLGVALALTLFVRVTAQYVFLFLPWFAVLAALPLARGTEFLSRSTAEPESESDELDDDFDSDEFDSDGIEGAAVAGAHAGGGVPTGRRALLRQPVLAAGWTALLVLPGLTTCVLYFGPRQGERPQWREAYSKVFELREPGDLVMGMAAPVGEYYLAPDRTDLRELREVVYLDKYRAQVPFFWDRFGRRTWFVLNREELLDWPAADRDAMQRLLLEECRLVLDLPLYVESRDLSVSVYVRD